jgi:hypothetical protein
LYNKCGNMHGATVKIMVCVLFNCLRVKNKPKKVTVAMTFLTCVWAVTSPYMSQDTDCFE